MVGSGIYLRSKGNRKRKTMAQSAIVFRLALLLVALGAAMVLLMSKYDIGSMFLRSFHTHAAHAEEPVTVGYGKVVSSYVDCQGGKAGITEVFEDGTKLFVPYRDPETGESIQCD